MKVKESYITQLVGKAHQLASWLFHFTPSSLAKKQPTEFAIHFWSLQLLQFLFDGAHCEYQNDERFEETIFWEGGYNPRDFLQERKRSDSTSRITLKHFSKSKGKKVKDDCYYLSYSTTTFPTFDEAKKEAPACSFPVSFQVHRLNFRLKNSSGVRLHLDCAKLAENRYYCIVGLHAKAENKGQLGDLVSKLSESFGCEESAPSKTYAALQLANPHPTALFYREPFMEFGIPDNLPFSPRIDITFPFFAAIARKRPLQRNEAFLMVNLSVESGENFFMTLPVKTTIRDIKEAHELWFKKKLVKITAVRTCEWKERRSLTDNDVCIEDIEDEEQEGDSDDEIAVEASGEIVAEEGDTIDDLYRFSWSHLQLLLKV